MELNILPILNFDGKRMELNESVEVQPLKEDIFEVLDPVSVKGKIVNIGGTLSLDAKCQAKLRFFCDRCMEPFEKEVQFEIAERFRKEDAFTDGIEENPDILPLSGSMIDLSDLVYHNLFMNLPTKHLCREECKGLCPMCGMNLNHGVCSCDARPVDPRFEVLDSLLKGE